MKPALTERRVAIPASGGSSARDGAFSSALVSAALVLLGLSGIYLWFESHKERVVGAALLTISLGYSLTTLMILLRLA